MRVKSLKLTEKQFMAQVVQLAKLRGWLVYHTYDSRRSAHGFPDLVLVRERVVWAELKVGKRYLTANQWFWLKMLREAAQEVYAWYPSNWPQIEKALA